MVYPQPSIEVPAQPDEDCRGRLLMAVLIGIVLDALLVGLVVAIAMFA